MNAARSNPRPGGRERPAIDAGGDADDRTTPGTDIQPEDVGTPESGNTGRGTAAEAAMKQASKTGHEKGGKR